MKINSKKIILLLGDVALLYLSLYLALSFRYLHFISLFGVEMSKHFFPFSLIFLIWILIFYINNLYEINSTDNNIFFQKSLTSIGVAGLLSFVYFYLTPQSTITPKTNLLIFIIFFTFLFFIWRQVFDLILKSHLTKTNIAIIGFNNEVKELIHEIKNKPHLGYKIKFIIDDNQKNTLKIKNIPILNNIKHLDKLVTSNNLSNIIIAKNIHKNPKLRSALFNALPLKINIIKLTDFYENITGKIALESINETWFLENLNEGNKKIFDIFKRSYDLFFAFFILLFNFPFWPIIGLIIKIQSPGPIFFKQIRLGKNNKKFKIIKFRTMNVEKNDFSPTNKNDKRIFSFGSFMRKTRIDEIPQILNIIIGDMSFIGPRPEQPKLAKKLAKKIPFYYERNLVKPGLSGWDQISGEYHSPSYEDTVKKLQYDLYYIKNRSIYLDISIALKTISIILSRQGL